MLRTEPIVASEDRGVGRCASRRGGRSRLQSVHRYADDHAAHHVADLDVVARGILVVVVAQCAGFGDRIVLVQIPAAVDGRFLLRWIEPSGGGPRDDRRARRCALLEPARPRSPRGQEPIGHGTESPRLRPATRQGGQCWRRELGDIQIGEMSVLPNTKAEGSGCGSEKWIDADRRSNLLSMLDTEGQSWKPDNRLPPYLPSCPSHRASVCGALPFAVSAFSAAHWDALERPV